MVAEGILRALSKLSPPTRWLLATLAAVLVANALVVGLFVASGRPLGESVELIAPRQAPRVFKNSGLDSWRAMSVAYRVHEANPDGDLYRATIEGGLKFQYPPSSLFLLHLLPDSLIDAIVELPQERSVVARPLRLPGALAVVLTILFAAACYLRVSGLARAVCSFRSGEVLSCVGVALILGLSFYPLQKGQGLGQVQVYLGALVALALLLFALGHKASAGVCLALCSLVKPQYAVALIWSALRRERRFAISMLVTGTLGLLASVAVFGFDSHLRYLELLSMLSRHGEVYWANHSVNGVMHRLLDTGDPLTFSSEFGAYNPVVYVATLLSTLALLGSALALPMRAGVARQRSRLADLGLCVVASTIASPIAWEHHYGVFLPVFAIAAGSLVGMGKQERGALPWLLLLSYVLVANCVLDPAWWFSNRWLGVAAAHPFWGGLMLFYVLLRLSDARSASTSGAAQEPTARVAALSDA